MPCAVALFNVPGAGVRDATFGLAAGVRAAIPRIDLTPNGFGSFRQVIRCMDEPKPDGHGVASDAELIGWSLAGDHDAFIEVVRRHARPVSAYLVRRAGTGRAEDLLGDVWVGAFASRGSYDRSFADARPWLFGIARNVLRSHWRKTSREDTIAELAEMSGLANPWPEVDERIDALAASGSLNGLRQALANLPADERDVLLLVAWEQLSVADAARALGIPSGTARYRLHRARTLLRQAPGVIALLREFNHHNTIETTKEAR